MNQRAKIELLRTEMLEKGLDAIIFPISDPHQSEYISDFFKSCQYFSGFTGSAATLIVLQTDAALWTDGRYFLQADIELDSSLISLIKIGESNSPTLAQYLTDNLAKGSTVGVEGNCVSFSFYNTLEHELKGGSLTLVHSYNLSAESWPSRPNLLYNKIVSYDFFYSGKASHKKLEEVWSQLVTYKAESYFISSLDDIAWLTNLRGSDITYSPLFYAYFLMTSTQNILFINIESLSSKDVIILENEGITIKDYNTVLLELEKLSCSVALDPARTSAMIYQLLKRHVNVIAINEVTARLKAEKNSVEIGAFKSVHLKDAIAVTKFLYWLSTTDRSSLTDWDCMLKIEAFRKEQEGYISHSFTPIFALGSNGAIIHYHATKMTAAKINHDGFMVLDSGAQYLGGTTDVTRTLAFGHITKEQKYHYSLVLKAHIALASTTFIEGATGAQLDGITRQSLWQESIDFKHGTGHGVGAMLSVHEGPARINQILTLPIKRGIVTSIEPGIYIKGLYGIRLENLYYSYLHTQSEFGNFLRFEVLTLVPFLTHAIDKSILTPSEILWLNNYHKQVYSALSNYFTGDELQWLKDSTASI